MKINYALFNLFLALFATFLLSSCSEEENGTNEITVQELPADASYFLSLHFPAAIPTKIEKIDIPEAEPDCQYKVTMPDGVILSFDVTGIWQEFILPDTTFPKSLKKLFGDLRVYMGENYPKERITNLRNTHYGMRVDLQSGQRLAFTSWGIFFIGYDLPLDSNLIVPSTLKDFTKQYFPDESYQTVLSNSPGNVPSETYTVWLQNKFKLEFDTHGEWTEIEGYSQEVPAAIIGSLPEMVKQHLTLNHPEAKITSIKRKGTEYTMQISENYYCAFDTESRAFVIPSKEIEDFIDIYFGKSYTQVISIPLHSEERIVKVRVSNGFDFTTDEFGNWLDIDGHGFPFPETLAKVVMPEITTYVAANCAAKISRIDRVDSHFLIVLTNGTGLKFTFKGQFAGNETVTLTAYEKVHQYMRHQYPEDIKDRFYSYNGTTGWIYKLEDGTEVKFDTDGNLLD